MIHRTLETPNNLKDVVMACQSEDADNFHCIAIDMPNCFNPSQTGLGVYLPAGSQTPTPPSLSASLPNTPGSWTSQVAITVEAPHPRDAKHNTWNQMFNDLTLDTDTTMSWNEADPFAAQEPSEMQCCAPGPSFPTNTGLPSAPLHSQRTSISSGYPNTSKCYRPDVHTSTPYYATKIGPSDIWFEDLHQFGISPSNSTTQEGAFAIPPTVPSLIDSYPLEAHSVCPFPSAITSPNAHQPSDLPSSGKVVRTNSLPGQPHEDLYEKARQSVQRIRKRRRTGTPARANYVCHICGRPFSRNYNLQIHLPTHTPDRPKQWPCTWTGCDKVFTRRTDLVRHEKCVSASTFRQTPRLLKMGIGSHQRQRSMLCRLWVQ